MPMRDIFRKVPVWFWGLLFFVVIQLLLTPPDGRPPLIGDYWRGIIFWGAAMIMVSLGMNLIFGFNGQLNLGIYGFYAIGAYASADITYRYVNGDVSGLIFVLLGSVVALLFIWAGRSFLARFYGIQTITTVVFGLIATLLGFVLTFRFLLPALRVPVFNLLQSLPDSIESHVVFFLALVAGTIFTGIISYLIGTPLLELGSDYLAIATMGFSIIVYVLLQNTDTLLGLVEMKGARGMVGIPNWTTWPWVFFTFVAVVLVMRNLLHSSTGRSIISVREDSRAAVLSGINVARTKVLAFVIGCSFAGLAGGIRAHDISFLHPKMFDMMQSFNPFIIIIFGGLGSMTGTIVAGAVWVFLLEGLLRTYLPEGFENWRLVIYPLVLLILILLRPGGLMGTYEIPFLRRPLHPLLAKKPDEQPAAVPLAPPEQAGSEGEVSL